LLKALNTLKEDTQTAFFFLYEFNLIFTLRIFLEYSSTCERYCRGMSLNLYTENRYSVVSLRANRLST